jgi:hypothetical protein
MARKKPNATQSRGNKLTLLEGLDDLEQAAIAREFEANTGRRFQCQPCMETGLSHSLRSEAESDEPPHRVVAVLYEGGQIIPLCEDCYERLKDSTETL